jgi:hypothetical protein
MGVWAGVMLNVSGFLLISCKEGIIRIFSWGLLDNRSFNPAAIVVTARLRLEQTNLEGGASGLAFRTAM